MMNKESTYSKIMNSKNSTTELGRYLDTVRCKYQNKENIIFLPPPHGTTAPSVPGPLHYRGFMITPWHSTLGRIPPDEWSAQHGELYLTTHNIHKRQTSMPQAGFEPTIPASERLQTHVLDREITGTDKGNITCLLGADCHSTTWCWSANSSTKCRIVYGMKLIIVTNFVELFADQHHVVLWQSAPSKHVMLPLSVPVISRSKT